MQRLRLLKTLLSTRKESTVAPTFFLLWTSKNTENVMLRRNSETAHGAALVPLDGTVSGEPLCSPIRSKDWKNSSSSQNWKLSSTQWHPHWETVTHNEEIKGRRSFSKSTFLLVPWPTPDSYFKSVVWEIQCLFAGRCHKNMEIFFFSS